MSTGSQGYVICMGVVAIISRKQCQQSTPLYTTIVDKVELIDYVLHNNRNIYRAITILVLL